jgi:hypothetical protein
MYKNTIHSFIFRKVITKKKIFFRRISKKINSYYNLYKRINFHTLDLNYRNDDIVIKIKEAEKALNYVRLLVEQQPDINVNVIPKKIWIYWNNGLKDCPGLIKTSYDSWTKMNPEYEVIFLHDGNLEEHLGFDLNDIFYLSSVDIITALKADVLRMYLLKKYGGIWVDSTTFCLKPLATWFDSETEDTGFFIFRNREIKTRPGEVWFIASQKNGEIISRMLEYFIEHIFKKRNVSLFVSNSIQMIGLSQTANKKYGLEVVKKAEKKFFMPYFSLGYFLNEAVKYENSATIWKRLEKKTNNYTVNLDPFEMFKQSLVSKQTYKKKYLDSGIFLKRLEYIKKKIEQSVGFRE